MLEPHDADATHLTIRPLVVADLPSVVPLVVSAYLRDRDAGAVSYPTYTAADLAKFERFMRWLLDWSSTGKPNAPLFAGVIAVTKDKVQGCAYGHLETRALGSPARVFVLEQLVTTRAWRERAESRLLAALGKWGHERGAQTLEVEYAPGSAQAAAWTARGAVPFTIRAMASVIAPTDTVF
jgi:hypothetical protein